ETPSEINAYRVPKIPPFWANDPEVWFATVEASFQVAKVTDDTIKFHIILVNADTAILSHIKDLIMNPPASQVSSINKTSEHSLLEQLVQSMNTLLRERKSRTQFRSPSNSYQPMRRRNRSRSANEKCFYHRKFGSKAYRCQQPYNWIDGKPRKTKETFPDGSGRRR
ncbi:hypothetical protein ALC57_13302, partial [Trachymyrmex cornetzi]